MSNLEYVTLLKMMDNYKAKHASHMVLGNNPTDMLTIYQHYYDKKQISKNKLPEATMKQLRSSHFNLGKNNVGYSRQSDNYAKFSTNQNFNVPHYESGTWVPKDAKFDGHTTHHRELPHRQTQPYKKVIPGNRGGFSLGNQGNNYVTEFTRNFYEKAAVANGSKVDSHPPGNIVIGSDKGNYQTEHKDKYKSRSNVNRLHGDNTQKYKDNVNIGGQIGHQAYITVYQDQYRKDQNNKSKMFHKTDG